MSYGKATELFQKCKEVQEKLKNIQKDFDPLMVFIIKIQGKNLLRGGNQT